MSATRLMMENAKLRAEIADLKSVLSSTERQRDFVMDEREALREKTRQAAKRTAWSTRAPTEPGVYWVRWDGGAECVEVTVDGGRQHVNRFGLERDHHIDCEMFSETYGFKSVEWAGPIEAPK